MASTSNQNSNSVAGWEIIPYVPLPVLNGPEDVVHQSKELSITEVPVGEMENTRKKKRLCTAKVVGTSYVYFKFLQRGDDPPQHALELIDVESSPEMEEGAIDVEHLLLFPHLLKGWKRETRERPNGTRDKFYFHATSTKMFRSVIEVVEYIKSKNNLEDAKEACKPKQLKGTEWINPSEASSSKENKRKNSWNQRNSESKQRRSFLGAYSEKSPSFHGAYSEKSPEQIKLEKFYATAYENLLKMFPPTPVAVEAKTKRAVEAFLAEAQENLLRTFEGEKNVRDTVIQSSVNVLPLNHGEQLNPQQKEGNGLTEKELEVAQMLSSEGLDRSKDKLFTSEDLIA